MRFKLILAALLLFAAPAFATPSISTTQVTVVATGSGALTYQWYKAGVAVSGATSSSISVPSTDVSLYTVIVTDIDGGTQTAGTTTTVSAPVPPSSGISPDGTTITAPTTATVTTAAGVWSFGASGAPGGYVVLRNGVQAAQGTASGTVMEVANGGQLYSFALGNWYVYVAGGDYNQQTTAPPPPTPPPATVGPRAPVGQQGSITCTGTAIAAGANIQTAVNAAAAGTTFCLGVGTFSNQSVTPKAGDIFIGKVGTILDGGGTTVRAFASTSSNPNVLIENLIVQNYTGGSQVVAIDGQNATGWTIVHNEVRMNDGDGIAVAGAGLIQYNYCHHNLELCYGSNPGTGIQILDNEIAFNNYTNKYNCGNQCGGGKLWSTTGAVVSYNYTHDNNGPGFWDDYDNQSITYSFNRIENNWTGIQHEIGYNTSIHDNTFLNNGKSAATNPSCTWLWCSAIGIYASGGATTATPAGQVEIFNNTIVVASPGNAVGLVQQNRQGVTGQEPCCGPWLVDNLWVHDNTIDLSHGGSIGGVTDFTGGNAMFSTGNNKFDRNHYTLGTNNADFWWNGSTGNKAFWQSAGQDPNGTFQ